MLRGGIPAMERVRALIDISCRMAAPAALSGAVIVAVTAVRELISMMQGGPGKEIVLPWNT